MTNREAINILRKVDPPRTSKKHFDDFMQARDMAIDSLSQPEPHWIPVTERLPETDKWRTTYIVTTDTGIVTAMEWENTVIRGKSVSRWIWHDRLSPWGVTAWMQKPEPYKGVTE